MPRVRLLLKELSHYRTLKLKRTLQNLGHLSSCFIYIKRRYGPIFLESSCTARLIIKRARLSYFFIQKPAQKDGHHTSLDRLFLYVKFISLLINVQYDIQLLICTFHLYASLYFSLIAPLALRSVFH